MAVGKTFACEIDPTGDGLALTYVVPTARCDLNCAFCFIKQRDEALNSSLSPDNYALFIEGVAREFPVRVSGIQGYEALLDDAWPYTRKILEVSNRLGIPTSLVTNGTHLSKRIAELDELELKDLTVSLDAPTARDHDRLRGKSGAFDQTVRGIRSALKLPRFRERLVVASVLLPAKRYSLIGMPRLLADLGVPFFGVTPLIKVGKDAPARMVQQHSDLIRDLDVLDHACREVGVKLVLGDEFDLYREAVDGMNELMVHRLENPGRLIRLTPSGACSSGVGVLDKISADTPVWYPELEPPGEFLKRTKIVSPSMKIAHFGAPRCPEAA